MPDAPWRLNPILFSSFLNTLSDSRWICASDRPAASVQSVMRCFCACSTALYSAACAGEKVPLAGNVRAALERRVNGVSARDGRGRTDV